MDLAEYVLKKRTARKWTQEDLAAKVGCISQSGIYHIESRKTKAPGIDVIIGLADAFRVPIMDVVLAYQEKDPDEHQTEDLRLQKEKDELYTLLSDFFIEKLGSDVVQEKLKKYEKED